MLIKKDHCDCCHKSLPLLCAPPPSTSSLFLLEVKFLTTTLEHLSPLICLPSFPGIHQELSLLAGGFLWALTVLWCSTSPPLGHSIPVLISLPLALTPHWDS